MFNPISNTLTEMIGFEKIAYRHGGLPKHLKHISYGVTNPADLPTSVGTFRTLLKSIEKGADPKRAKGRLLELRNK